jgi:ABC-2 type transport system permease protein
LKIILAIASKDIKEAFRNRSTYIYIAFLFFISFPTLEGLRAAINRAGQGASDAALVSASRAFLRATVSTLPLTLTMLFCTYLSAYAIVLEKAKRTLESLLATPASLRQVWMGKTLAVAVPSVAVTLLVLIVAVVVLNVGVIVPATGSFVLPDALSLITGLVLVPLLAFEVVAAVSVLQLVVSNPRIANFAFVAVFFGFYLMTVTQIAASWDFSLIYVAVAVAMAAVNLALSRLLTKERVVLSSKA